jgi:hypothetical protein
MILYRHRVVDADQGGELHRSDAEQKHWIGSVTISAILIAANMCLQGGTAVDVSPYVPVTAVALEIMVTMRSDSGVLIIYSPGYEARQASFTKQERFGVIPIAEPVLCVKAVGGPFEFDMRVMPVEYED